MKRWNLLSSRACELVLLEGDPDLAIDAWNLTLNAGVANGHSLRSLLVNFAESDPEKAWGLFTEAINDFQITPNIGNIIITPTYQRYLFL